MSCSRVSDPSASADVMAEALPELILTSLPAAASSALLLLLPQSVMEKPLKPHSPSSMSVISSRFSEVSVPLTRL